MTEATAGYSHTEEGVVAETFIMLDQGGVQVERNIVSEGD